MKCSLFMVDKMSGHVLSVCVFCLLCATHSPCDSHAIDLQETAPTPQHQLNSKSVSREKFKIKSDLLEVHKISKRNSIKDNNEIYLNKLFSKYGNGEVITMEGFRSLLENVFHEENHPVNDTTCVIKNALKSLEPESKEINSAALNSLCPAILYSLVSEDCENEVNSTIKNGVMNATLATWLYSISAVFVISACGVISLFIIPVMQKKFYKPLLQFLVALAVGTLAGDALLHLLPHAMSTKHHSHGLEDDDHQNMWKGFVAMLGLILFFVMERFIPLLHRWRKGKPMKNHSHVKVLNSGLEINKAADTKCMDKYNAIPRCYKDIVNDPNTTFLEAGETSNVLEELLNSRKKKTSPDSPRDKNEANQNSTECPNELSSSNNCTDVNKMSHVDMNNSEQEADYTVILTEHGAVHHGHSHLHGHVHSAPQNFSSVAWMVIMGDGLHNFTDGMAIGAAFSGSTAGGFSTAVAVFCHELPHEVGDFAMLLKAGMSIKQAFFYNIISSILCFLGNILGIWLGNTDAASSWVFAVAAGTFIYIALVDMIPELSSAHEDEGNLIQCILHLSGLLLGFGIMTLIAVYEHDLKHIFSE